MNTTDYTSEHKAWQQRIEQELYSSNQQYLHKQFVEKASLSHPVIDHPYGHMHSMSKSFVT